MLRRFWPVWKPVELMKFIFDDFVLDTEAFTLVRNGVEVGVESRVLETLIFLIQERHRVVSKEELLDSVWDIDFASEATVFKAIQQARKAVGDDGKSQRLVKTVHGKGYRFVAEVEEDTGQGSVPAAPQKREMPVEAERPGESSPTVGRWPKAVAWLAVGIVVLGMVGWLIGHRESSSERGVRTSVAILNCVGDPSLPSTEAWMSEAVPELLFLRLRGAGGLRMIPADEVAGALRDLTGDPPVGGGWNGGAVLDRLACDVAVGSRLLRRKDGGLQLELTVFTRDAVEDREIKKINAQGDLFALAGETGADLAQHLSGGKKPDQGLDWTSEVQPEAFARYVTGLGWYRDGDLNEAVSVLAPLVAQYPQFALARIALAKVYRAMGLKAAAGLEARTALDFSADLPAETRLQLEALTLEIDGDWGEAARIYRSLWSVAGDEVEYPLALIRALRWDGRSAEALEVAKRLGGALDTDPRLHLELSRVYQIQGETEKQRASLEEAVATATVRGATGRLASATLGLGWVDLSQQKLPEAEEHFSQAEELFRSIGNRRGEARAFKGRATVLSYGPNPEISLPLFEQAARLQRGWGDFEDLGKTLYSVTGILAYLGDVKGSLETGLEVLEIARKTGDREVEGAVLVRIGDAQVDLGDPVKGMETYLEALPILEDQGATRRLAGLFNSMGLACEYSGDMPAAVRHFGHSAEMWQNLGRISNWFDTAYNLAWLHLRSGDLPEAAALLESLRSTQDDDSQRAAVSHLDAGINCVKGDFEKAEREVGKAISLRERTGEGGALDNSRALMFQIHLGQGRHEEVLAAVESEMARLREDDDVPGLATALLIEAEARGQAGRWREALESAEEARSLQKDQSQPQTQAETAIVAGRINIHLGRYEQAALHLDRARQAAERSGLALLVMEAEIARAELRLTLDHSDEARSDVVHLRRQCERRGWGRLAARASSVLIGDDKAPG